jgi:hypothetical protein
VSSAIASCRGESDTANSKTSEGHADARWLVCPIVSFPGQRTAMMLRQTLGKRCSEWESKGDRIDGMYAASGAATALVEASMRSAATDVVTL